VVVEVEHRVVVVVVEVQAVEVDQHMAQHVVEQEILPQQLQHKVFLVEVEHQVQTLVVGPEVVQQPQGVMEIVDRPQEVQVEQVQQQVFQEVL